MRWLWLPLLALAALLLSPVTAQPVITGWRPPTGCSTNQVIGWNGSTWTCQSVTAFSTNNVIPKGNGTTLTSSSWTDNGTTSTTTGNLTSGNDDNDTFDHNGELAKFGGTSNGDGSVYVYANQVNSHYATASDGLDLWLNYRGAGADFTHFRNTVVGDGKGAAVATFTGSSKAAAFNGNVTLGDASSDSHTINGSVTIADADADAGFTVNNTGTGGRSFSVLSTSNASGVPNSLLITDNTAGGALRFRVDSSGNISGNGSWTLGDGASDSIAFNNGPTGVNNYAGRVLEYNDEWLLGSQLAVGNGWNGATIGSPPYSIMLSGTSTAITPNTGVQRPGVISLETGTTTTGLSGFRTAASPLVNTGDTLTWEVTLGIPTLSDGSEEFAVKTGFFQAQGVDDTYGCYALYDRGNVAASGPNAGNAHRWSLWAMDSSGGPTNITTTLTSSPTISAATWPNTNIQRLRIVATSTACTLFIDVGAGYVQQANITTNISTHSLAAGTLIVKSAGTTSRKVDIDQTRFLDQLAAVRSP